MFLRSGLVFIFGLIFILAACNQDSDSSARFDLSADACNITGCIGDFVWNDVDPDGIQGDLADEPGLGGVVITLYALGPYGNCQVQIGQTTSDPDGSYIFIEDPSIPVGQDNIDDNIFGYTNGQVCLHFDMPVPAGYTRSPQDQGDDTKDSDAQVGGPRDGYTDNFSYRSNLLGNGSMITSKDAGYYKETVLTPSIDIQKEAVLSEITAPPSLDICEDGTKPKAIILEYVGGTCLDSNNTQGSKTDCSDGAPLGAPVQVMVDDSVTVTPDDMSLMIGSIVIIESTDDRLSSSTEVHVTDGSGGSQLLDIHTSCSAPIQIGDQFGSMILRGFTPEGGASSNTTFGGMADFTIRVENTGNVPLTDVTVSDLLTPDCDFPPPAVPPAPPVTLAPTEWVTYTCTAFGIMDTFTNEATATGTDPNGTDWSDSDTATVTVVTPPEVCAECKGGVVEMTMTYKGSERALVEFYNDKDPKDEDRLFSEELDPGESFTVSKPAGDDKLNKDVSLWIDGVKNAAIHTSCSKPIGEGAVFGFFEVTNARSKDKGLVCPVPVCDECEGGVVFITFQYNGEPGSVVEFFNDSDNKSEHLLFEGTLNPGDSFTLVGPNDDLRFNNSTSLWVDGVKQAEPHMSCSQPIGPGSIFGDFEVMVVHSRNNGNVCPVPPPPACQECKGGVVNITFQYNGLASGEVKFFNDSDNKPEDLLFEGTLAPGDSFTLVGPASDLKFNNSTSLWVNDVKQGEPHMSCSQPIGPGSTFGVFSVTEVFSKDNGNVCPVPPAPEAGLCDDGRPQQLSFQYLGYDCSATTNDQEGSFECDGDPVFAQPVDIVYTGKDPDKIGIQPQTVSLNGLVTLNAFARDELHSNSTIEVRQGGTVLQSLEVHTSCSKPIAYGDQFGALKLIDP